MGGPLQAILDEEQALKQKLKERRQNALATGYERRNLLEPGQASKAVAARRENTLKAREARRPSVTEASLCGPSTRIEHLMRPTAVSQLKQFEKRLSVKEEKLEEPEFTEEQQSKWDKFLHKNSIFAQQRETHLENLRKKKEEQDIVGCTFEPQKLTGRKSAATHSRSSLFDRARLMEAKKEARMAQIRQELFDKEMAQCSFHPNSRRRSSASCGDGVEPTHAARRPSMPSVAYQDGGSKSNSYASGASNLRRSSSLPSGGARRSHATPEETSSSGSEYWEGNSESGDKENSLQDITILPSGQTGTGKQGESPPRPPKMPGHNAGGGCRAFEEARQLKVMQRLQERRQLLQETLTPDDSSATSFRFDSIVAPKDIGPTLGSSPAAAVAEAVERMEDLLLGDFADLSDLENSDDESQDDRSQSNSFLTSSEALVRGDKGGRAALVRPSRVGD